ncbi:MAG TPA: 50S ribosomal protein L22 [Acidobacteriota bacterium]|nr:50S ribosomal protein L22 [Acidobacteriota bacterium]HMV99397.1 50S ribosomal protein L22 [Acidobacteriota bacterium]HMZ81255.1 50S ribosomal protein L22 [Acidobacteriota bacterium]HNB69856.1 50S ribosomal protein L22 [Acidobacteriota bacterium]HNC43294.1 50S ribosomal protein L22 [Acidobacteriota bacterium]
MEARAVAKYIKGSPQKARLVIDQIRGVKANDALALLRLSKKRAAHPISKALWSAISNATYLAEKQNIMVDVDDLVVTRCFVDMGPTKNRRRVRSAPMGRAYREQRRSCHITVYVSTEKDAQTEKK